LADLNAKQLAVLASSALHLRSRRAAVNRAQSLGEGGAELGVRRDQTFASAHFIMCALCIRGWGCTGELRTRAMLKKLPALRVEIFAGPAVYTRPQHASALCFGSSKKTARGVLCRDPEARPRLQAGGPAGNIFTFDSQEGLGLGALAKQILIFDPPEGPKGPPENRK
jgi:hypothetical protein